MPSGQAAAGPNEPDQFLRRAISLAAEHMRTGDGGPFGAVIVRSGVIISEGWNCVTSTHDPTAHAEIVAIRRACAALGAFSLAGSTLFTSCEPCPMCLAATYWARVDAIWFAATRADAAAIGFDDDLLYRELGLPAAERSVPLRQALQSEAQAIMTEWAQRPDRVRY